jgi:hypothetical protein
MYPERERREFPRLVANPQTRCDLSIDHVVNFRALAVKNVSLSGVGLRLDIPVPVGKMLRARLEDPARGVGCSRTVRVVYCAQEAGAYVLGGFFDRGLSPTDMEALTENDPAA